MGDFAGAEEAFARTNEFGVDPQPGLALLRLWEGNPEVAVRCIKTALDDESLDVLARARLRPAHVEIALTRRDLDEADEAASDLERIAASYGSAGLSAAAAHARGAVDLARGDVARALPSLRKAWHEWHEMGVPYEAARARMLLAEAHRAEGDEEAAALQFDAAASALERLGAVPDARRAREQLGGTSRGGGTASGDGRRTVKVFAFTDIVQSTSLVEVIGDDAWQDLLRWHDQTLRSLFARHEGEEVDKAGDGFFVAFPAPRAAIDCAVAIQRTLAEHRRTHGFAPQIRIGLHAAESTRSGRGYRGKGVHEAARIAALATGGEILASRDVFSHANVAPAEIRSVEVKGVSKPLDVAPIRWS